MVRVVAPRLTSFCQVRSDVRLSTPGKKDVKFTDRISPTYLSAISSLSLSNSGAQRPWSPVMVNRLLERAIFAISVASLRLAPSGHSV